jgi:hypothetical protein
VRQLSLASSSHFHLIHHRFQLRLLIIFMVLLSAIGSFNCPAYAQSGVFQLSPTTSQSVTMPSGTTTGFNLNSIGNMSIAQQWQWNFSDTGQGYDLGNNGTSAQGWSTGNVLTDNAFSMKRGIFNNISGETVHYAIGDTAFMSFFNQAYGGAQAASDEGVVDFRMHNFQLPYFSGPLTVGSVGRAVAQGADTSAGFTFIAGGGGGSFLTFPVAGTVNQFCIAFGTAAAPPTAQAILWGIATPNGGLSYTLGTPMSVTITSAQTQQCFSASVPVSAGQTIYAAVPLGEFGAGQNGGHPICMAGSPSAGTFTFTSTCPNTGGGTAASAAISATLAPYTTGSSSVFAPLSCNGFGCTDINSSTTNNFADGGILLDTTQGGATAVLGGFPSIVLNGISQALTSGTVAVSSAWGNIIGSSCTGNGNGQFQNYTATTCNVTLGTSPASPGNFVVSGGITSCPAAGGSITGTALDIGLSGPFAEEAYVIAVGTPSAGVQSITFCTRYAWNNTNGALVMQGGPIGQSMVATYTFTTIPFTGNTTSGSTTITGVSSTVGLAVGLGLSGTGIPSGASIVSIGSGTVTISAAATATNTGVTVTQATTNWPVAYALVGATSPTQIFFSDCLTGTCNAQSGHNLLPTGTEISLFPSAFIIGTQNGISGIAQLATNTVPFVPGDTIIGAPASEFQQIGFQDIFGQNTPANGSIPSFGMELRDVGGVPVTADLAIRNEAFSTNPAPVGIEFAPAATNQGFWSIPIKIDNRPTTSAIFIEGGPTLAEYGLITDNAGGVGGAKGLRMTYNPALGITNFRGSGAAEGIVETGTFISTAASQFAAGTTVGGIPIPISLTGTTATITGTALSATCDSGSVTVSGATVGHPVGVSSTTGADVGGAFNLRASVTAANTVTVFVCGTGTPPSLAYNVSTQ